MATAIVQHHVTDYEKWYPVYVEHGAVRRQHGGTGHAIFRAADDPNNLIILNHFATLDGAKAFAQDPSLPDAMERAGVDSAPQVWLAEEVDAAEYAALAAAAV